MVWCSLRGQDDARTDTTWSHEDDLWFTDALPQCLPRTTRLHHTRPRVEKCTYRTTLAESETKRKDERSVAQVDIVPSQKNSRIVVKGVDLRGKSEKIRVSVEAIREIVLVADKYFGKTVILNGITLGIETDLNWGRETCGSIGHHPPIKKVNARV